MSQTDNVNMTYADFIAKVNTLHIRLGDGREHWRYGQTYFNVLASVRSDLSEIVRGTVYDPFYEDKIPEKTEKLLQDMWDR